MPVSTPYDASATGVASYSPIVLSILRVVTALLFIEHGTTKLFDFPSSGHAGPAVMSLMGFAGFLELIGGSLLALGLFTRAVAFVLSGEMAVAYFMAHFPHSFVPTLNGGESAVLFCFVFLYLSVAGAGTLSLDALRKKP
jgi:putative oxidoreductase